jgi:hypothetical protein
MRFFLGTFLPERPTDLNAEGAARGSLNAIQSGADGGSIRVARCSVLNLKGQGRYWFVGRQDVRATTSVEKDRNGEAVEQIVLVGVDAGGKSLRVEKGEAGIESEGGDG